jgi:hypothetical protein
MRGILRSSYYRENSRGGYGMSAKSAELLNLLKELALLKELDEQRRYGAQKKSESDIAEFEDRQTRRREIADQIKALADPQN